ncbi:MAG: InlB B-repeat-containing protein [Bacteroidales bacterium]|nr:InlB B-repeat-containing protein [Bacteroidales bacterium]
MKTNEVGSGMDFNPNPVFSKTIMKWFIMLGVAFLAICGTPKLSAQHVNLNGTTLLWEMNMDTMAGQTMTGLVGQVVLVPMYLTLPDNSLLGSPFPSAVFFGASHLDFQIQDMDGNPMSANLGSSPMVARHLAPSGGTGGLNFGDYFLPSTAAFTPAAFPANVIEREANFGGSISQYNTAQSLYNNGNRVLLFHYPVVVEDVGSFRLCINTNSLPGNCPTGIAGGGIGCPGYYQLSVTLTTTGGGTLINNSAGAPGNNTNWMSGQAYTPLLFNTFVCGGIYVTNENIGTIHFSSAEVCGLQTVTVLPTGATTVNEYMYQFSPNGQAPWMNLTNSWQSGPPSQFLLDLADPVLGFSATGGTGYVRLLGLGSVSGDTLTSDSIKITILERPAMTMGIISAIADTCSGGQITLTVTGSSNVQPDYQWSWSLAANSEGFGNGPFFIGNSQANYTPAPSGNVAGVMHTIQVSAQSLSNVCRDTATVTFRVFDRLNIEATASPTLCWYQPGPMATITAPNPLPASGYSFSWYKTTDLTTAVGTGSTWIRSTTTHFGHDSTANYIAVARRIGAGPTCESQSNTVQVTIQDNGCIPPPPHIVFDNAVNDNPNYEYCLQTLPSWIVIHVVSNVGSNPRLWDGVQDQDITDGFGVTFNASTDIFSIPRSYFESFDYSVGMRYFDEFYVVGDFAESNRIGWRVGECSNYMVSVSANPSTGGSVTGGGLYIFGTSVTVTATANTGYNFVDWTQNGVSISTNASYQFTVTSDTNLVANFEPEMFAVTVRPNNPAYGVVNITSGSYGPFSYGTQINITATTVADLYVFVNWTEHGSGAIVSTTENFTYTVTGDAALIANFMPIDRYFVNIVTNPVGAGIVPDGAYYADGTNITVSTTPNTGYDFVNWTINGVVVSTSTDYNFDVVENVTLVANFTLQTYTVAVSANPSVGGTVTGGGRYTFGTSVTVTATPSTGYNFIGWTENDTSVSANASYEFTATGNRNLVANFELQQFTVTARPNNPAYGVVAIAGGNYGPFDYGTQINVTAATTADYVFVNWIDRGSGAIVSVTENFTYTVTKNTALVANFMPVDLYFVNLVANPDGGGITTGSGYYTQNTNVQIVAIPSIGYDFVNWTMNGAVVSTTADYNFDVVEDVTLVANFTLQTYTVAVSANPLAGGSAVGGGIYNYGDNVTVIATPSTGYTFANWTKNGVQVSTVANYTFTAIEDVTLVANFELQQFAVTVRPNNPAYGVVNILGGNYGPFNYGTQIDITATTISGDYIFVNWTDHTSGAIVSVTENFTYTVTKNTALVANFMPIDRYFVNLVVSPVGGGTVTGSGYYTQDSNAIIVATPSIGYDFVGWTNGSDTVTTNLSYSFNVIENVTFVANFMLQKCTVSITASPVDGGSVTGDGVYNYGDNVTVTATPNVGYQFVNWTILGAQVSTDPNYTFTAIENVDLIANFTLEVYTVAVSASPSTGGNVTGGGLYTYGTSVTVTATPSTGYNFVGWTENGVSVSTNANYQFTVTENRNLVANFELQNYTVTLRPNNPAYGMVAITGGSYGPLNYGTQINITATTVAGLYVFVNWTEHGSGAIVSTTESFTYTVTGNASLIANFMPIDHYFVNVVTNPVRAGVVPDGAYYADGTNITVSTTPNTGYDFVNWTINGVVVSTTADYNFDVVENVTLVANFTLQTYTVSVSANPSVGGTVTGGGRYTFGTSVTVTATPSTGYNFIGWTENGTSVSTNASYEFTATGNRNLVANFELQQFTVTVRPNNPAYGVVNILGGFYGPFDYGTQINVTATTIAGDYIFVNWTDHASGAIVSVTENFTYTVTKNTDLVANFMPIDRYFVNLVVNPDGGGTVTGSGYYTQDSNVTIVATPSIGYDFVNWTKDGIEVTTNFIYRFNASEDVTFVANFVLQKCTVSVSANPTAGGSVAGGGIYNYGDNVVVTAIPNIGYDFVNWTKNGVQVSTVASYTFTAIEDVLLVANFVQQTFTVTVRPNNPAYGVVNILGGNYGPFNYGTQIDITAATIAGDYIFVNWTDRASGAIVSLTEDFTYAVTKNANLIANFMPIDRYFVNLIVNPVGGGTVTGSGYYAQDSNVVIVAKPSIGYDFVGWTNGSDTVTTNLSYSFNAVENVTFVANFTLQRCVVSVSANPLEGGSVTGDGVYNYGDNVTVTATPNVGYQFVNWTMFGVQVSTDENYTFTAIENVILVANFTLKTYMIAVSSSPTAGGNVTGGGLYTHGTSVTVAATPNTGYNFIGWTENGTSISGNQSYEFTAVSDRNLVANFELQKCTVTVRPNNPAYGVVNIEGGFYGPFDYGTQINITAATIPGNFVFVNWTEHGSGAIVSTTESFTYTVTKNVDLIANFRPIDRYFVSLVVNPIGAGTVPDGAYYADGTNTTVTTTANEGYTFVNWTLNGTVVSVTPDYNFDVTESVTLVANYVLNVYTVAVSSNPTAGGIVTGGGRYVYGTSVTVMATPNVGYNFVGWTENDTSVSGNASYQITVVSDRNLVANFELQKFTVTVRPNNPAYGVVNILGGFYGPFDYGTQIDVTATTIAGDYIFVNWTDHASGAIVSTTENFTYTVTENVDLIANFMPIDRYFVNLVVNPPGAGTTMGSGYYRQDSNAVIMANASIGYDFIGWTNGNDTLTTNLVYSFNVVENVTFVANFMLQKCTVSVSANPLAGGSVTGGGVYNYGDNVTVVATPSVGYDFASWTKNGVQVSTVASYTFTAIEDVQLTANFVQQTFRVTVRPNNPAYGVVSGGGSGIVFGTGIPITATTTIDYVFVNWTDHANGAIISTIENFTYTVVKNTDLIANFMPIDRYFVNLVVNPVGGGTVVGDGYYTQDSTVIIVATPSIGYDFVGWTNGSDTVTTDLAYTFNAIENVTFVANFMLQKCTILVSANPLEGGSVTGGGVYSYGDNVTVMATVNEGYTFASWTIFGAQVSTDPNYTFIAFEDINLVANFDTVTYPVVFNVVGGNGTITATINGSSITSGNLFNRGSRIVFTALSQSGYIVKEWTFNDTLVDGNMTNTFTIDSLAAPAVVTIRFAGDETDIDIGVGPGISVDPDPNGNDSLSFIAFAPCGMDSVLVIVTPKDPSARILINGVEGNTQMVYLPNYGNNPVVIRVIAESGSEQDYMLTINRLVPFWDMVVMHWNNTLSIINNPDNFAALNSSNFRADSYRWFGNGQQFSTNQWYSAGPESNNLLNDTWEYVAQGITEEGNLLRTCPQYITLIPMTVSAHPNPVAFGETLYIEADLDESLLKNAVIEVFDFTGKRVDYLKVQGRLTPVHVRYSTGLYIFVLKSPSGFTRELKVIVQ